MKEKKPRQKTGLLNWRQKIFYVYQNSTEIDKTGLKSPQNVHCKLKKLDQGIYSRVFQRPRELAKFLSQILQILFLQLLSNRLVVANQNCAMELFRRLHVYNGQWETFWHPNKIIPTYHGSLVSR